MKRSGKMRLMTQAYRKTLLGLSAVFVVLFVGMFVVGELMPTRDGSAVGTNLSAQVTASGYTLSLELVSPETPGTVALSANAVDDGTWVAGKETVRTSTNSPAGYQLFLSMDNATSNALTGSNDRSHTLPAGGGTFAAPATLAKNHWGYAVPDQTGYDGAFSGDYTIAADSTISPSTTWATMPKSDAPVRVANEAGQANGVTTQKDLDIYYGVAVDMAVVSDTYLGTVLYSAISDATNTGTPTASISPNSQTIKETGISVDITTSLLTTTDLTTSDVTATIGGATCPVTAVTRNPAGSSNPNAVVVTCTAPASASVGKKDVVVTIAKFDKTYTITEGYEYLKGGPGSFSEVTEMQQLADDATLCANATTGTIVSNVEDTRDGQKYTIFKAADGNCWMGENLRFGINPDGSGHPFTNADIAGSDSNLNSTKMLDLTYNSSTPNTAGRIKNGSSGMKANNGSDNAFSSAGDNYTEPYINIYQANQAADYDGQTKYGVQYNYCAVTGGTACTDSSTDYNPTGSICPKGWKLPGMTANPTGSGTSTGEKSYNDLFNAYGVTVDSAGFNKITPSPLSFVRAGGAFNGSLYDRSSSGYGYYWSSTKYSSANFAYGLSFGSLSVYQNYGSRYDGFSARCVSE